MFYKVLEGVRVIEYGNLISAPFCAKIMADQGAEVIKIEEPKQGDEARRCEPFLNDIPGLERSGLFLYLNMNKLGITLNLRTTMGRKLFAELLRTANVFIENNPPKKAKKLGINYQYLKEINPRIVMTSITPFGQTGPYKEYKSCELLTASMGGGVYASTREIRINQEPIKLPAHLYGFQAGASAAVVTIGGLYHQMITGSGSYIDFSEQESVIQNLPVTLQRYCYKKQIVSRTDRWARAPYNMLPCKDGYIAPAFMEERQWRQMVKVIGNPDWADNELFKDSQSRAEYWDALEPLLLEWTMEHTMDEICQLCQEAGAPVGAVYTAKDILNSGQMAGRGFIAELIHPETGYIKYPGIPYLFNEIPRETPIPAPLLGQHNEEVYCRRLGYSKQELVKLNEAGVI